jgi:uncharacterized membrane protein HdeD (DUF308 family)
MANNNLVYEDMGFGAWNVSWWDVGLRALIAILFGLALLFWPGISLLTFVYLFAAFAFFDGVLVLLQMVTVKDGRWFWRLLQGLIAIAAAAIVVVWPGKTLTLIAILLGSYWVMTGILELLVAIDLRKAIKGELLLVAAAILSMIVGGILIFHPFTGLVGLAQVIGILNIALGIILALLAAKLALAGSKRPAPA